MPFDTSDAIADMDRVMGHVSEFEAEPEIARAELTTMLRSCIERWSPPGSSYARMAEHVPLGAPADLDQALSDDREGQLRGILSALMEDYRAGRVRSFIQLVHAALFDDFLGHAEHLLGESYPLPAAVVAGAALEEHLRQLAPLHGVSIASSNLKGKPLPRKASELNDDLHKGKAYSQPEWRQTQVWLDLRNEAAHGKPEFQKRTDADIRPMVAGIRAFIVKYPA